MVVPLNFIEDRNKKSGHKSFSRNVAKSNLHNDDAVDVEGALPGNCIDQGVCNDPNAMDVADGVNDEASKNKSASKERSNISTRQTIETISFTPGSESTCRIRLLPHGEPRTYWDLYISFLLLYVGAFVPYRVSFLGDLDGFMGALELFVDISFGIDIILNFITGMSICVHSL